jgi:hypothetical protein
LITQLVRILDFDWINFPSPVDPSPLPKKSHWRMNSIFKSLKKKKVKKELYLDFEF